MACTVRQVLTGTDSLHMQALQCKLYIPLLGRRIVVMSVSLYFLRVVLPYHTRVVLYTMECVEVGGLQDMLPCGAQLNAQYVTC